MKSERVVTTDPFQVADRLAALGLSEPILASVVRAMREAFESASTPLHPKNAAGVQAWHRGVVVLRDQLLPLGWKLHDVRGSAQVLSPDGSMAIVISSGDEGTGSELSPSTMYRKGIVLEHAVDANQLSLFDVGRTTSQAAHTNTWILLVHANEKRAHAELSLPETVTDGFPVTWTERIVLTPIEFDSEPRRHLAESAEEVDVPITRKA